MALEGYETAGAELAHGKIFFDLALTCAKILEVGSILENPINGRWK